VDQSVVPGIPSAEEFGDVSGDAVDTVLPLLRIKLRLDLPISLWPIFPGIYQRDGVELLVAELAQPAPQRRLYIVDGVALVDDRARLLRVVPLALDGLHSHLREHLKRRRML
jgi:hypothetical protein